jgi:carbon monoxide dehydrogenase subunit G
MKSFDIKGMTVAIGRLFRARAAWVALVVALLFLAAPGVARAQATCAIDFSVSYNAVNYQHVMSMTTNFDEFAACDPRYVANPGDPASGFTPYVQTGATANGGSFVTAVNAADDTISYTAPTGFSGTDTFTVYFCNDANCSGAGARVATVTVTVGTPTIAVNPASLPAATVAAAYSQTLTGSGGQAPYGSFTVTAGALPAGLSLAAGGALTGTPTASGTFNFTIRTTDSTDGTGPFQGSRAYTLTVNAPTVTVSPTTVPAGTVGVAYSQTITGGGGTAPYGGFTVTAGALPAGLSLAAGGALTGTPTAGGSFNFTIRTTDSTTGTGPHNGSRAYSMTVNAPTISVGPTTLPNGTQGSAYSQTITATGGTGPSSFAVTAGALPAGLTLATGGGLAGTPTVNGSFNFTVTATDSSTGTGPYTGSRAYSLVIDAPPAPVANAVSATVAYNSSANPITLNITGAAATSVAVASPGANGTATASGTTITYTPTAGYAGPDSFTYTATNASGTSAPATVTMTVSPPTILLAPASLPNGINGIAYSEQLSATGGTAPYSFATTAGALPGGLTLSAGGLLSGTPNATGPFNFTVTASDSSTGPAAPFTDSQAYSVTIAAPNPPVANAASATVAYNSTNNPVTLNITGGIPTSVAVGTPPTNGTATATGTSITYTPTAGYFGSDSFTYTATNAEGTSAPATVTITVNPQPPTAGAAAATVAFNSAANPITLNLTGGAATSVAVATPATNGTATASGTSITYTPTAGFSGSDSFTYTATNAGGTSAPATVTITVNPATPIAGAASATVAYNSTNNPITLNLTGGTAASVAIGTPPTNGSAAAAGMSITYTPTAGYFGADSFTYTATNAGGTSAPATVSVTVATPAAPTVAAASASAPYNTATAIDLSASITGVHSSIAVVTAPAHGTTSVAGDVVTYTPTAGYFGADSFTYTATGPGGTSAPATVSITVATPTAPTAAAASANVPYDTATPIDLSASITGIHSSIAVASPPANGTTSVAGSVVTYTPATGYFGADSFTYTATGPGGTSAPAAVSLSVAQPNLTFTPPAGALPDSPAGAAYDLAIGVSGGVAPYRYGITSGALPDGLSLAPDSGRISGTPTVMGSFGFAVTGTDALGATGTASYTMVIVNGLPSAPPRTIAVNNTATSVDLGEEASGGPFTAAAIVTPPPPATGTASIASSGGRFVLTFTPVPGASGVVSVIYTLANTSGTSAPLQLTFVLSRPNPALDPQVTGLLSAQAGSAQGFATNQIGNFRNRLERLHNEETRTGDTVNIGLDTSALGGPLAYLGSLADPAIDAIGQATSAPYASAMDRLFADTAFWATGSVSLGTANTGVIDLGRTLVGMSGGMDHRFSPDFVAGIGFGYGRDVVSIGNQGSTSLGQAISASLYGSYHPGDAVFIDGQIGIGRLGFEGKRFVSLTGDFANSRRDGTQVFGSLSAGYQYQQDGLVLVPYGRAEAAWTRLDSTTETGAGPLNLSFGEQSFNMLAGVAGLRLDYAMDMDWGTLTPQARLEYSHDFAGGSQASVGYADMGGPLPPGPTLETLTRDTISLTLGTTLKFDGGLLLGFDYDLLMGLDSDTRRHAISVHVGAGF